VYQVHKLLITGHPSGLLGSQGSCKVYQLLFTDPHSRCQVYLALLTDHFLYGRWKKVRIQIYLLGVFEQLLALLDEVVDDVSPCLQLSERLLLTLNQLLHILDAAWSDVPGGAEHDAVQELDVRLEVVAVGVALPVEVDLDLGCGDGRDEIFVLLDQRFQSENIKLIF